MHNSVIAQGLARQQACPEIHKKVQKLKGTKIGFDQSVLDMVIDLKESIPELSLTQLSSLVGVSRFVVTKALEISSVPEERWTSDDNEVCAAAELAALQFHYSDRRYEDAPEAEHEVHGGIPVIFSSPALRDSYRVADQSHTVKRPITLATRPFGVAA